LVIHLPLPCLIALFYPLGPFIEVHSIHFGLINPWCSAPQLLLVHTQTATNW
ncbi:unnamed protein product, partial [Hymenolepis diminuta]